MAFHAGRWFAAQRAAGFAPAAGSGAVAAGVVVVVVVLLQLEGSGAVDGTVAAGTGSSTSIQQRKGTLRREAELKRSCRCCEFG